MIKLKCKECKLFYTEEAKVCERCGGELKKIVVHELKPMNVISQPKNKIRKI